MGISIFTNLTSINAQRHLSINDSRLARSVERVSSGLRINSASDDAAGLAISEKMRSDIRVLQQGVRNLNDGVSMLNTTEASLGEMSDMIIRMRELAAQAASGTIGDNERALLQVEVDQLVAEVNRIASASEFNGQKLLDGSFTSLLVHFGLDATANSQIDIAVAAGFTANMLDMAFILTGTGTPSTAAQAANFGGTVTGPGATGLVGVTTYTATVTVDGVPQAISILGSTALTFTNLITELNADLTGATASISGGNIVITSATTGATSSISIADTDLFAALTGFVSFDAAIVGPPAVTTVDISTAAAAQTALTTLDTATDRIVGVRARVAAVQNRLERIISTQNVTVENLIGAESQIRDADIAAEIALLTRNQILVEAATAMVAQANLIPPTALLLLQ